MKKIKVTVALFLASWLLLVQTGCFGKFALVRKVYEFHDSIMGDDMVGKIVKSLLLIFPMDIAYGIGSFLDIIIFNLIEFWTGSNPIAMVEGEQEIQMIRKGDDLFKLTATKNQMHIKQLQGVNAGQEITFMWQPEQNSWYMLQNGEIAKVADIEFGLFNTTANYYLPNGMVLQKSLDTI